MNNPVSDPAENNFALFVGSLSANTTQEHLIQYFSRFGQVQGANLITDWATGASKRCAIVFCADEPTCVRALSQKMHRLDGKLIRVSMADHDKKGTKKISTTNLFVGNIGEKCTEEEMRVLFDKFGQIESVRFFRNASTKANTKNAIIQYVDSHSVELAFKNKSEMGTADDSLKISPLKQKKAPGIPGVGGKLDGFDDMASMVMQMCSQNMSSNMSAGRRNSRDHSPRVLQMPVLDSMAYQDPDFFANLPVRHHRKSSSVDFLPAAKSNPNPDFYPHGHHPFGHNAGGFGHFPMQGPSMKLTSPPFKPPGYMANPSQSSATKLSPPGLSQQGRERDRNRDTQVPVQLPVPVSVPVPAPLQQRPSLLHPHPVLSPRASLASLDDNPHVETYNFVTLIDIFNDEDGLSASFYGVSPMRQSRGPGSVAPSKPPREEGDSDSGSVDRGSLSQHTS